MLFNCRPQPEHPRRALRPPAGRPRAEHAAGELGAGGRGGRRAARPAPGPRGGGGGRGARRAAGWPPRLHLPRGVGRADELPGECLRHDLQLHIQYRFMDTNSFIQEDLVNFRMVILDLICLFMENRYGVVNQDWAGLKPWSCPVYAQMRNLRRVLSFLQAGY